MPNPSHLPYPFDARITCLGAAAEGQNLNEICTMKAIKCCPLNLMFGVLSVTVHGWAHLMLGSKRLIL